MKKYLAVSSLFLMAAVTSPVMANGSVQNFAQGGVHSAQAASHSLQGSAQVLSGVAAVPLQVVKVTGEVSGKIGDRLQAYSEDSQSGFEVSEETVSVGPAPDRAVKQ